MSNIKGTACDSARAYWMAASKQGIVNIFGSVVIYRLQWLVPFALVPFARMGGRILSKQKSAYRTDRQILEILLYY